MTRNLYEDQTWELTLSDMQGLLGPGNLLTPEQVESLSSSHKTMNVGNYNVRLTIAELADEFNYITHVDYTVLVWRYGREMAMRGEGVRLAQFKEDGELIRYIECRCQACMQPAYPYWRVCIMHAGTWDGVRSSGTVPSLLKNLSQNSSEEWAAGPDALASHASSSCALNTRI